MTAEAKKILKPWLYGQPTGDGEWRGFCAYCEDPSDSKTPSASYHLGMMVWHCMGKCGAGGSIKSLVNSIKSGKLSRTEAAEGDEGKVTPLKNARPLPSERQVNLWHRKLMGSERAHNFMADKRSLDDDTLKQHRIGWDSQRYTIPIYNIDGELVNIRRYKPNARDHKDKMVSWGRGRGEGRIYGFETLAANDDILLCEGELDRLLALQEGLPAVTHTAGAPTFKLEWGKLFKGKNVYIAYDEDAAGDQGAQKVRKVLEPFANSIYRVKLETGRKGGDITDFFQMGRTASDMRERMEAATCWHRNEGPHIVPSKGKRVSVEESQNAAHNYPIEMTVMVAGKVEPPYLAPKKIVGNCDMAAGPRCASCYFSVNNGERVIELLPDDERLLGAIDLTASQAPTYYAKLTEAKCTSHVSFDVPEEYTIEELAIAPSVEHRTEAAEVPIHRSVYNVGTYRTPVNHLSRIVGQQRSHPKTNRGVVHGWHVEPVDSDIDTFVMTPQIKSALRRFQPSAGQSPLEKCVEIADDLAANVTRIFGRPMMHVGYDLVWHSATTFMFEGKNVTKGWLECLVIGDTRTGKSETASALMKHYKAGMMKPLEGATFAGLVGGNDKMGSDHFMVKWGLIPINDRRLVVLDEMSGLYTNRESKGIIEQMSSIRSEGKAQISKIASAETSARTRLVWITNPINHLSLSESSVGCLSALQDLVRNPEDIARFDFVMAASQDDVPSSTINSTKHRSVKHRATKRYAQALVMWAWSRRADQVLFRPNVEELIYAAAEDLGSRYVSDPPLVQIANVRVKVARIAVAMAARTFSTDRTGELIVVRPAHVRSAVQFLDTIYGETAMGYKAHSEKIMDNRKRAEKAKGEARKYLRNQPQLVETLLAVGATDFRKRDFEEFGGVDREDVSVIVPMLLGWRMIKRKSKGYMSMEPALVELLRELEAEGG